MKRTNLRSVKPQLRKRRSRSRQIMMLPSLRSYSRRTASTPNASCQGSSMQETGSRTDGQMKDLLNRPQVPHIVRKSRTHGRQNCLIDSILLTLQDKQYIRTRWRLMEEQQSAVPFADTSSITMAWSRKLQTDDTATTRTKILLMLSATSCAASTRISGVMTLT